MGNTGEIERTRVTWLLDNHGYPGGRPNKHSKVVVIRHRLEAWESKDILNFALSLGANKFTMTYVYFDTPKGEKQLHAFYKNLEKFLGKPHFNPKVKEEPKWPFNEKARDIVLDVTDKNLLVHTPGPEDLKVFIGDRLLVDVITHEGFLVMNLEDKEYIQFFKLAIDHLLESQLRAQGV